MNTMNRIAVAINWIERQVMSRISADDFPVFVILFLFAGMIGSYQLYFILFPEAADLVFIAPLRALLHSVLPLLPCTF